MKTIFFRLNSFASLNRSRSSMTIGWSHMILSRTVRNTCMSALFFSSSAISLPAAGRGAIGWLASVARLSAADPPNGSSRTDSSYTTRGPGPISSNSYT